MKIKTLIAHITLTLTLTITLGYCFMNLGPVRWILQTHLGRDAFYWLFSAVDFQGTEGAEDLLSLISLGTMLIPSILICAITSKYVRKLKQHRK